VHPVKKYIKKFVDLPDPDWARIEERLSLQSYGPETLLLEQGKICRNLYFLEKGLLRFFVWREGRDVTKFFTQAPYCFTSQQSFTKEIPARESIATLEDSLIWTLSREDAFDLFRLPSWNTFVRLLIQEVQSNTEDILEELQNITAEERYLRLLEEEADLVSRVPLKYLASYLGIAAQSLSRIRKKLASQSE